MDKEKQIDYKEYAKQMRENAARSYNGTEPVVICSAELWEEIATIIENGHKQSEGEWIIEGTYLKIMKCSVCDSTADSIYDKTLYCPNCGAKMKGEQ